MSRYTPTSFAVIHNEAPRSDVASQTTAISASAAETTIVTAGPTGENRDLIALIITNSGTAVCSWTLRDATGGSAIAVFDMPAAQGSPLVLNFVPALPQSNPANNWTLQCSTATSTGAHVTAVYAKR